MTRSKMLREFWQVFAVSIELYTDSSVADILELLAFSLNPGDRMIRDLRKIAILLRRDNNLAVSSAFAQFPWFSIPEINTLIEGEEKGDFSKYINYIVDVRVITRANQFNLFFSTLDLLLSSGMPVILAIKKSISDAFSKDELDICERISLIIPVVTEGDSFASGMERAGVFTPFEVEFVALSESKGILDKALSELAKLS